MHEPVLDSSSPEVNELLFRPDDDDLLNSTVGLLRGLHGGSLSDEKTSGDKDEAFDGWIHPMLAQRGGERFVAMLAAVPGKRVNQSREGERPETTYWSSVATGLGSRQTHRRRLDVGQALSELLV